MASITGTNGADTLRSTSATDSIRGLAGNDTIYAGPNDTVDGGPGTDRTTLLQAGRYYLSGVETITGSTGADNLVLRAALSGGFIDLRQGADRLTLSSLANNSITVRNIEVITGGTRADTITFNLAQNGATVGLGAGTDKLTLAGGTNKFTVNAIETIVGSSGADTITFSAAQGMGTVALSGGTDKLNLAAGTNTFRVSGVETINGNTGDDAVTVYGSPTATQALFNGKGGDDTLTLHPAYTGNHSVKSVETVVGNDHNQEIDVKSTGTLSVDLLGGDDDVVSLDALFDAGLGSSKPYGEYDSILTANNVETIHGDTGNDYIDAFHDDNAGILIFGYEGHDYLGGANGPDILVGGFDNDDFDGFGGEDWFVFGPGHTDPSFGDYIFNFLTAEDVIVFDGFGVVDFLGYNQPLSGNAPEATAIIGSGVTDIRVNSGDVGPGSWDELITLDGEIAGLTDANFLSLTT